MRHLLKPILMSLVLAGIPVMAAPQYHLYSIAPSTMSKTLYYSGKISPIVNVPVISGTAGVVSKMMFNYGAIVKKDQTLLGIESTKVIEDLRNAKIAYLNALADYDKVKNWNSSTEVISAQDNLSRANRALAQAKNDYEENTHLFKLGIVSRDELYQSQDNYQNSLMSQKQAARSLTDILAQGTGNYLLVKQLQLEIAQEKYESLQKQVNEHQILAPASGIVLIPENTESSSSGSSNHGVTGKIEVGSQVDYQQVLMNIGDMSGLKINFNVPEISIDQIHVGLPATITGAGFPGITLQGVVTSVAAQANNGAEGGGSLPSFAVVVEVQSLTPEAKQLIRAGMDAQIALTILNKPNTISVPIQAVHRDASGQTYVFTYDAKTKAKQKTSVKTGTIGLKDVEILSGLQGGEQVILDPEAPSP